MTRDLATHEFFCSRKVLTLKIFSFCRDDSKCNGSKRLRCEWKRELTSSSASKRITLEISLEFPFWYFLPNTQLLLRGLLTFIVGIHVVLWTLVTWKFKSSSSFEVGTSKHNEEFLKSCLKLRIANDFYFQILSTTYTLLNSKW